MKRLIALALIATVLTGCQGSETATPETATPVVERKAKEVDQPGNTSATKIGLLIGRQPAITVGCPSPDKVFNSFRDPKQFGTEYNDLPPGFGFHYRARSWETAHTGFGEITYDGELVAAMYQEDGVKQDRVDEIVSAHKNLVDLLPVPITGKRVSYWFWDLEGQRLMICAYQTNSQGIKLTMAMGDTVVMDALGISPKQAGEDAARLDKSSGPPSVSTNAPLKAAG